MSIKKAPRSINDRGAFSLTLDSVLSTQHSALSSIPFRVLSQPFV